MIVLMNENRLFIKTLVLVSVFFLVSCSYYTEKNPGDPSTIVAGSVNWERVSAEVFNPRCSICHGQGGAGINTTDYQSVVQNIHRVQEAVFSRQSMPPDSPLTDYEQTLLRDWIQNGLPQ